MTRELLQKSFIRRVVIGFAITFILFTLFLFCFAHCVLGQDIRHETKQPQKSAVNPREAVESLRSLKQQDYVVSSAVDLVFDRNRTAISEYIGKNKTNQEKDMQVLGVCRNDALMLIARNYLYRTIALRSLRDTLCFDDGDIKDASYIKVQKKIQREIEHSENGMRTYVLQALKYGYLEKIYDVVNENQTYKFWDHKNILWEIVAVNDRSHRTSFTYRGIKYSFSIIANRSDDRSFHKLTVEVEAHDVERKTSFRRIMTDINMNGSVEGVGYNDGDGKLRTAIKRNASSRERTGWREKYLDALENFVIVTKFLEPEIKSR